MTSYESLYKGASFLLDPNYNFTGYRVPVKSLGATTSIQTSNQLNEVNKLLNQGIRTTEISVINAEVFEMIPKEHLNEIKRLNKLTGAESSMHAPVIDPAGFSEQGWTEENRRAIERQFTDVVLRSHDVDPTGNIPVTIHSSGGLPGSLKIPLSSDLVTDEEREKGIDVYARIIAVDRETGKPSALNREKKFYPEDLDLSKPIEEQGKIYTAEEELAKINKLYLKDKLYSLVYYKERADAALKNYHPLIADEKISSREDVKKLPQMQQQAYEEVKTASLYLDHTYENLKNLFNESYKFTKEEDKSKWVDLAKEMQKGFNKDDIMNFSSKVGDLITGMQEISEKTPPEQFISVERFVNEKASETLSNVALKSYKQFGNSSPIISIENPPYGMAVSTGAELAALVKKTRESFTEKLVKDGKSHNEASEIAAKLIGATWDTSHMSMIRKQGFDSDQVTKETKAIAPFVKHVHFNDNFGTTHTDLPPGMGDLPMMNIQKELEKAGFKGKKIFEGGNYVQNFQKSPFLNTLAYSGSPMYKGGPYWNQVGALGNYYGGHGAINPSIHHSLYSSSFSSLPTELGGEIAGSQSRFSGTPTR